MGNFLLFMGDSTEMGDKGCRTAKVNEKILLLAGVLFSIIIGILLAFTAPCRIVIKDGKVIDIRSGWLQTRENMWEITIPEGVREIGSEVFSDCRKYSKRRCPGCRFIK